MPLHQTTEDVKRRHHPSTALPEDQQTRVSQPADTSIFTFNPMRFFSELNCSLETDHEVSVLLSVEDYLEDLQQSKQASLSDPLSKDRRASEIDSTNSLSFALRVDKSERRLPLAEGSIGLLSEDMLAKHSVLSSNHIRRDGTEEAETPSWRMKPDACSIHLDLQSTDNLLCGCTCLSRSSRIASIAPSRLSPPVRQCARIHKRLHRQSKIELGCYSPSERQTVRSRGEGLASQLSLEITATDAATRAREDPLKYVVRPAAASPARTVSSHRTTQKHPTVLLLLVSLLLLVLGVLCE